MTLNKKDFLARMSNAYDMGLCTELNLNLLESWVDGVMRFEGGQLDYWFKFLEQEYNRLDRFASSSTLANDRHGYQIIQLAAILTHPCQDCAIDPEAWHTRSAFCNHKRDVASPKGSNEKTK